MPAPGGKDRTTLTGGSLRFWGECETEIAPAMTAQQLAAEQDVAQASARDIQQTIEDQLIEASFRDALLQS